MTICIKKRNESTKGKVFTDPGLAAAYMLGRRFDHYEIWKNIDGMKTSIPFISADVFEFEKQLKIEGELITDSKEFFQQ